MCDRHPAVGFIHGIWALYYRLHVDKLDPGPLALLSVFVCLCVSISFSFLMWFSHLIVILFQFIFKFIVYSTSCSLFCLFGFFAKKFLFVVVHILMTWIYTIFELLEWFLCRFRINIYVIYIQCFSWIVSFHLPNVYIFMNDFCLFVFLLEYWFWLIVKKKRWIKYISYRINMIFLYVYAYYTAHIYTRLMWNLHI